MQLHYLRASHRHQTKCTTASTWAQSRIFNWNALTVGLCNIELSFLQVFRRTWTERRGEKKGRSSQREIKTIFFLFFFFFLNIRGHVGENIIKQYLPYFVCMRRTLINDISFSGRAVLTDIHRRSCMLQYVGFDGSKWDCRKDENYLNGMKLNVDIVQVDWYRVCLLHSEGCIKKVIVSLWTVFLSENEINCQSSIFWIIYRLARVETSRGLFLNQGNVH